MEGKQSIDLLAISSDALSRTERIAEYQQMHMSGQAFVIRVRSP